MERAKAWFGGSIGTRVVGMKIEVSSIEVKLRDDVLSKLFRKGRELVIELFKGATKPRVSYGSRFVVPFVGSHLLPLVALDCRMTILEEPVSDGFHLLLSQVVVSTEAVEEVLDSTERMERERGMVIQRDGRRDWVDQPVVCDPILEVRVHVRGEKDISGVELDSREIRRLDVVKGRRHGVERVRVGVVVPPGLDWRLGWRLAIIFGIFRCRACSELGCRRFILMRSLSL